MKYEEANQLTEKIIAIILEHQNGFSKEEAKKAAPECSGDFLWEEIESLLVKHKPDVTFDQSIADIVKQVAEDILMIDILDGEFESNFDDFGIDDLDYVEYIMALEKRFNISITDYDAERFKTFGDIVRYLKIILK